MYFAFLNFYMQKMDYDVLVIGAGVVGLACAMKIAETGYSVLCIERHDSFGNETSSRNSEVIHAGIYYPKDSLKANLCVQGNNSLYEYCRKYNIPHRKIGKFIVAVDPGEEEELERIYHRGKDNGVENLRKVSVEYCKKQEPHIKASAAIRSPDTGIIDSHSLMYSFMVRAEDHGCDFVFNHKISGIEKAAEGYNVIVTDPDSEISVINVKYLVNSAGLDSDKIAEMAGLDIDKLGYPLHYCRGHYFRVALSKKHLANHLIYPVTPKNFTNLGIHVTKELDGSMKLGPDAQYLDSRDQDYQVPVELIDKFYEAASRYISGLEKDDLTPDQSGIRPKLQEPGGPVRDFIINEESINRLPGLINLIGIESPGLTCCLEIAKMVKEFLD